MANRVNQSDPGDTGFDGLRGESLRRDLEAIARVGFEVPPAVDDAILNRSRAHLAGVARRVPHPVWLRRRSWVAAAAVLTILILPAIWFRFVRTPSLAPALAGDIDQSGRLDMLDAFALARRIRSNDPLRTEWDVNGDGVVNEGDVQWLAARAVSLGAIESTVAHRETASEVLALLGSHAHPRDLES